MCNAKQHYRWFSVYGRVREVTCPWARTYYLPRALLKYSCPHPQAMFTLCPWTRASRPLQGQARGWATAATALDRATISKMSTPEWSEAFKQATVGLASMDVHGISYTESAQRMRDLLRTGLLRHTDLTQSPERFFLAHRFPP